jgi:hypothetical protein
MPCPAAPNICAILQRPTYALSCSAQQMRYPAAPNICASNGNASETKVNESFDNGVFFDIEAKLYCSISTNILSKEDRIAAKEREL